MGSRAYTCSGLKTFSKSIQKGEGVILSQARGSSGAALAAHQLPEELWPSAAQTSSGREGGTFLDKLADSQERGCCG